MHPGPGDNKLIASMVSDKHEDISVCYHNYSGRFPLSADFFNFNDLVDAVADLKRGKNDGFAGLSSDRSFHYWL